jgi:hypothetical protein
VLIIASMPKTDTIEEIISTKLIICIGVAIVANLQCSIKIRSNIYTSSRKLYNKSTDFFFYLPVVFRTDIGIAGFLS